MRDGLFLDQDFKPKFEKSAMSVKLSDNPDNWQREIASEVFKQLPYLSDFSVNVVLDRVEPQRGYAYGAAEVTNKTDAPIPDQPESAVRIPLIVKDRILRPIDVMLDGKEALPLNERRLREKLFRSDAFELSTRKPTDQGMVDQLYPPMRTNYGYGNSVATGVGVGGFGKQASISLCEIIAPTISSNQFDAVLEKIASDSDTAMLVQRNKAFYGLLHKVAAAPVTPIEKTAKALVRSIAPTVVQFTKLASGDFTVKWANIGAFAPQEMSASREQASAMAGQDLSGMRAGQTMTITTEKAKKETLDEPAATKITEYGSYVVKDEESGASYEGTVLPVVDFQMQPLELFVFVGNGVYGIQDDIVGVKVPDSPPALGGAPQGEGVFVYSPDSGSRPFCTVPLTVQSSAQGPDGGEQIYATDAFGAQITLIPTPGLLAFEPMDEDGTSFAVPDDLKWLPMTGKSVGLARSDSPDAVGNAKALGGDVTVKSTGAGETSLDGVPVAKIARDKRWFLKHAEASFLLCAMGLTENEAKDVIKEAETQKTHQVKLSGLRPIRPLSELHAEMEKRAGALLGKFDYEFWRRDLVKEAAALEDTETADKVLAMNFINPENVSIFASYLPDLDTTATKLAEMLLASRLGMSEVPEGAAERAMRNMEEVIGGLRTLQQKQLV